MVEVLTRSRPGVLKLYANDDPTSGVDVTAGSVTETVPGGGLGEGAAIIALGGDPLSLVNGQDVKHRLGRGLPVPELPLPIQGRRRAEVPGVRHHHAGRLRPRSDMSKKNLSSTPASAPDVITEATQPAAEAPADTADVAVPSPVEGAPADAADSQGASPAEPVVHDLDLGDDPAEAARGAVADLVASDRSDEEKVTQLRGALAAGRALAVASQAALLALGVVLGGRCLTCQAFWPDGHKLLRYDPSGSRCPECNAVLAPGA